MIRHKIRPVIGLAMAGAAFAAASPALAQECSRDTLQAAVDSYIEAQEAGDRSRMRLADGAVYKEQFQDADIASGVVNQALTVDFELSLLDEERCETFTEILVTDPANPYVLGVHLTLDDAGAISEIDTIVTDDDDWMFSARRFLDGVILENWSEIPADRRDDRETLIAAADPYFPMFNDVSVQPPWHTWCYRQEAALRTGGTCHLDQPLNVDFGERDYLVDPVKGMVVGLVLFSENLPDSHLFRVIDGRVSNIHTITACIDAFNCGFDLPDYLIEERQARGGRLE